MPSKRRPTVERVRYREGQAPAFLHGHGVIHPGELTEALSLDEARRRADFEVVVVPATEPGEEPDEQE